MVIIVKCSHFDRNANEIVDYQNTLELDDAVSFDFQKFLEVLRILNPRSKFISFINQV